MYKIPLVKVKMEVDKYLYSSKTICGTEDIYSILKDFIGNSDRERFLVVHLTPQNKIISIEEITTGCSWKAHTSLKEIFRGAILSCCGRIVLVHNHPLMSLEFSRGDYDVFNSCVELGKFIGISVVDSIVLNETGYNSIKQLLSNDYEKQSKKENDMLDKFDYKSVLLPDAGTRIK